MESALMQLNDYQSLYSRQVIKFNQGNFIRTNQQSKNWKY